MTMKEITENKEEIVEKAWKNDKKFIEMTVDIVLDYLEENPEGCSSGKFCPEALVDRCTGMPFVTDDKIKMVVDMMYREGYLKREIPEGTGTPHYSLK
ncbi:MAG: hypothetical protein KGY76_09735 [Candidatus Thermoplasmatota archaeon]|nr:hypothetical protein [Candidatus Thermoplasmatota archaeon]